MEKPSLSLQPSEAVVVQAAATIYAAYWASGKVGEGREHDWMRRAVQEAFFIARHADETIRSDTEMG